MDPIFYSPSNGIPSESKLATYMSRQNVTSSAHGLSAGISRLTLDSPKSVKNAQVTAQSPEFIPSQQKQQMNGSPNLYTSYQHKSPTTISHNSRGEVMATPTILIKNNHHNSSGNTSILGSGVVVGGLKSATSSPVTLSGGGVGGPSAAVFSSIVTPIKNRSLIRNESPISNINREASPQLRTPQSSPIPTTLPAGVHQENVGGTIYFYPTPANAPANQNSSVLTTGPNDSNGLVSQALAQTSLTYPHHGEHIYPGPASNLIDMQPKSALALAFFIPDDLRSDILARNELANLVAAEHSHESLELSFEIDNYHSLYALEQIALHPKLPLPSTTYKATNSTNGIKYCLRRLHGFRLQSTKCMTIVDKWKKLQHPNLVQMREVFTSKAFGDHSLVLVYDYYPGSQTLLTKYFTPHNNSNANGYSDPFLGEARPFSHKSNQQNRNVNGSLLPETDIWAIVMQLTSGVRAIHQAGLACRTLDPTKIIVTGKRVRFSFLGISDIVSFDPNHSKTHVNHYQQEDLTALGKLVLALACRCLHSVHRDNVQQSIELVSRQYSSDLRNLIIYLLTTSSMRSVADLMPMIGARFYTQLDSLQSQCDLQQDELAKEMENGRLYRLVVKLGFINERPEYNLDVTWSETGDRYMLKLFRDYLFHSVTEDSRPWLDHAHIVQCLNKLDAGTTEKVQLMSRDEQSVLVVTYAELKNCLENAFSELVTSASAL